MPSVDAVETPHKDIILDSKDRWWCSRLNRIDEVAGRKTPPAAVTLRDCTLREGEETPGTYLTVDTKIELAKAIQDIGLHEIEVGYCGAIAEHEELTSRLRDEGITASLTSINRSYTRDGEWQDEIDRAAASGVDFIHFVTFCNDALLASVPWLAKKDVPERLAACIRYAKNAGVGVGYSLASAARTDPEWMAACGEAAAGAGVDVAGLSDSNGCALPETVHYLVQRLRKAVGPDVPISFHGHNTFGLATANALAAVNAGASVIDTVALGLGEGAGIAALEEVAFSLEILYGISTGLEMERIADLIRLVAIRFETQIPATKAIVGDGLFRHTIDSHIASILRGEWHSWECFKPEVVNQKRALEFGYAKIRRGRSGAIGAKIEQMGYVASDEQIDSIISHIREITLEQRWATEEQVEAAISKALS